MIASSTVHNTIIIKTRKVIFIRALCLAALVVATMQAAGDKSVTAAQVNGTWKTKWAEFKIWALGPQGQI
jgi:hypothetical protein